VGFFRDLVWPLTKRSLLCQSVKFRAEDLLGCLRRGDGINKVEQRLGGFVQIDADLIG